MGMSSFVLNDMANLIVTRRLCSLLQCWSGVFDLGFKLGCGFIVDSESVG